MSLLLNKIEKEKEKNKQKEENGNSNSNISKEGRESNEEDVSNLTNIKVFNGLIEENNIFKNLNKNNNNQKEKCNIKNNKNNKNEFSIENKMIDLNYISFGDCDNIFVNNINTKKNEEDKKIKKDSKNKEKKEKNSSHSKSKNKKSKHSHSKKQYDNANNNIRNIKIEKKYVEEILTNDSNKGGKTMSFNDPKEMNDKKIKDSNINNEIIERKEKESKNYFKISAIKNGISLLVTGNDTVFNFPAYLLPKGAKLGESFTLEIKLHDNNINKKEIEEIEKIQKKYE